jgi:hypothetical protein
MDDPRSRAVASKKKTLEITEFTIAARGKTEYFFGQRETLVAELSPVFVEVGRIRG